MRFISQTAVDDYVEAVDTYGAESLALGERLRERIKQTYAKIRANPRAFARVHEVAHIEVRKAIVPRFPYSIVFYMEKTGPSIVAVAHAKREPLYWESRVDTVDDK
jgi:hypothetical protein